MQNKNTDTLIDCPAAEMERCRRAFELEYMEHYGLDLPPSYIQESYMEPRTRAAYHFWVIAWHHHQREISVNGTTLQQCKVKRTKG